METVVQGPADPSLRDGLTGLPNRRALMAELRQRMAGGEGTLVMLDLDGYHRAVESLSKKQVERLLTDVTVRLTVAAGGSQARLFRYAGDAFCLVLDDPRGGAGAAEALRAAISEEPFDLRERPEAPPQTVILTASAAAASFPRDGRTPTLLVETAELALLVAKHSGRNRVALAGQLDPAALAGIGVFRGLPCPLLVGRVQEQSKLRKLASDVRHVGPAVALVEGASGCGKTRLVRELAAWARGEKFVVLWTSCQESRAGLPYAALAEAIENLQAVDPALATPALERLSPIYRAALSVVVRDLPVMDARPPRIEIADYGRVVFEAFGAFLDGLSQIGPLVVALDEAEFADAATLQVFRAGRERHLRFLLVLTTDREPSVFDASAAGDFFRSASGVRITISPLGREEMRQALRAILPEADVASDVADQIVNGSKGNPLYLEETVRSLLLRKRMRLEGSRWVLTHLLADDLAEDLDGAVRAVAEALPARANTLLTGAAVLGTYVDPELLQEVLGEDEMEMLDLIDEARRSRVLVASDAGGDLLSFPAAQARRVTLLSSAEQVRREIHGRVGVVQEARHGGDVAHLAGELAYHYGHAGNAERAQHFSAIARKRGALLGPPRHGGTRRARLEPVRDPLSPEAKERILAVLRHFGAALHTKRLYPQSSQVTQGVLSGLQESFGKALDAADRGFTIAALPTGPLLNGSPCEAHVAQEFASLMDERLLESMTFLRPFKTEWLEVVFQAFLEPFDRVNAPPDFWERFLDRERLEHADLVQKAYTARERDAIARVGEAPVPTEELPALRDALRHLKAAVDNTRLYPPGHSLVEETVGTAARAWVELMGGVPAVTLGTADHELVVNGLPADRKFFGDGGAFVAREVEQRNLKSFSFKQGLAVDEVRAFVSFLAIPAGDPEGARYLERLTNVQIGAREYERAKEGVQEIQVSPPPRPIRAELRARRLLSAPYETFLSTDLDEHFAALLETLAYGVRRPLAEELLDRVGQHFHDREVGHRVQAFNLLARTLVFASPATRKLGVQRSAPPIRQRLVEDRRYELFAAAADILPYWIPAAVTVGCLREALEIVGTGLRKKVEAKDTLPEVSALCEAVLRRVPETQAFPLILAAARRQGHADRISAMGILLSVGGEAVKPVVEMMLEERELTSRRPVAMALGFHRSAVVGAELARLLTPEGPVDRLARFLEVAEPLLTPALAGHFAQIVEAGIPEVRQEVLRAVEKWPSAVALPVVKRLVASANPAYQDEGLELATRLLIPQVSPEVGRILEGTRDERLMERCSRYFEAMPNLAVVPLLAGIAERRPKLFGLVKGFSAGTRAAAVRALRMHDSAAAKESATRAERDPHVRALIEG